MGNILQTESPNSTAPTSEHDSEETNYQSAISPENENENEIEEFTCEICVEPAAVSGKSFRNGGRCAHPFCTDCVVKYIRVQLEDNNAGEIRCPALDCDRTLDAAACAEVVGVAVFVRWCDVLCESAILGFEKCYCPYRNCGALIVDECGRKVKRSKCPNCRRLFCFECKRAWHAGVGCGESAGGRDRNDVAFRRLAERMEWKSCPRCRHFVELTEGCPIVKCRCGISFCYSCQVQVDRHWCRCMTSTVLMCVVWWLRTSLLIVCLTVVPLALAYGLVKRIYK